MHPQDCPVFEYADHSDKDRLFADAVKAVLRLLQNRSLLPLATDTRFVHAQLFRGLCPVGFEYYAGHYRGENFRCLKHYSVIVSMDPRVGTAPALVAPQMQELALSIRSSMAAVEAAHELPSIRLSAGDKILFSVASACSLFVDFLTIHPYANGNGHIARWLLIAVLRRHGYRLDNFPVEPRPPDPPYSDMISRYRDGDIELLERYVLSRLS